MGAKLLNLSSTKRWSPESSGESRGCSRAKLRPINTWRDAEWNTQIRWRKLIESDARRFQLSECEPYYLEQRLCRIQPTIRHAGGSMNDTWTNAGRSSPPGTTSPECTSRKLRRRNWHQRKLIANYNSEIETDLWRSRRRYAADELFNKEPLRAEYRSRQDISKNY